jgi:hypothetical protein
MRLSRRRGESKTEMASSRPVNCSGHRVSTTFIHGPNRFVLLLFLLRLSGRVSLKDPDASGLARLVSVRSLCMRFACWQKDVGRVNTSTGLGRGKGGQSSFPVAAGRWRIARLVEVQLVAEC